MATIKTIRRRIKSAKNITQITKAMEMVAASKMRRAQQKALAGRPYAMKVDTILKRMSEYIAVSEHPFLQEPEPQSNNVIGILLMSTDKGLCGSLNSNLFKHLEEFERTLGDRHSKIAIGFEYVTVGKKARDYVLKTGRVLHAEFTALADRPAYDEILPISQVLLSGFENRRFYKIYLLSTNFVSTMAQKPANVKLLPIDTEDLKEGLFDKNTPVQRSEYIFEPSSESILKWLLPYYFELSVYQRVLEAQASEHSARMVAMHNASDNAKDIVKYLNTEYNRKRQASITNELADIVTSRMAVG